MILNLLLLVYLFFSLPCKGYADPIVGGQPVGRLEKVGKNIVAKSDNKFAYVAQLSIYETKPHEVNDDKQCGGVLIGPRTVLTAAHCVKNMKSNPDIEVTVGRLHMLLKDGQIIAVGKYKTHENYVKKCGNSKPDQIHFCRNDIALLWLEKQVVFSTTVQVAILASKKSMTSGKSGLIFGWGITEDKKSSPMLLNAEQKVVPLKTCKAHFPRIIFDKTKLCLISETFNSTMCHGDSGSPFVSNGVVLGIASFSHKTCDPKNPSVFTNVAQYEDWIKNAVKHWSLKESKQLKFHTIN